MKSSTTMSWMARVCSVGRRGIRHRVGRGIGQCLVDVWVAFEDSKANFAHVS